MFGHLAWTALSVAWLNLSLAQASGAPAQNPLERDCAGQRSELRERAMKTLNLAPDTNVRDGAVYKRLIAEHCDANLGAPANRSTSRAGHCERTYGSILALIRTADREEAEACELSRKAAERERQCNGQKICQQLVARNYREAERLMNSAKNTTAKAEKWLGHYVIRHGQVAQTYAAHLRLIAKVIEEHDRGQAALEAARPQAFVPLTAIQRERAISDEVRRRLSEGTKKTEGVNDVVTMLQEAGVGLDPARIRAKAEDIERTSRLTGPTAEQGIQYEERYGDWAGEQLLARHRAQDLLPVVRQVNTRLDASARAYAEAAARLEGNVDRSGSVPQNPRTTQAVPAAFPRPGEVDVAPRSLADAGTLSSSSASLPGRSGTSASALPPAGSKASSGNEPGPAKTKVKAAPGRRLALSPGESAGLADMLGRPLAEAELAHEVAMIGPRTSELEEATEESEEPAHSYQLAGGLALSSAGNADTAGSGMSSGSRAPAQANDPKAEENALAYADRQLKRLEQGRNFGPSLRDRLRAKLAADYKNRSGNTRAAADLFEEMHRDQKWESDEDDGEEQMDALSAQEESLFARVSSAHRRSLVSGTFSCRSCVK